MTDAVHASARLSADLSADLSTQVSAHLSTRPAPASHLHATHGPATMVPLPTLLHAIAEAYAAGDAPLGERLFLKALDEQLPWDVACAAAARGVAARYDGQPRA